MSDRKSRGQSPQATLRVGGVLLFVAVLGDFGVDPDDVFTGAGIDPALLEDPDNLITYAARNRLMAQCVTRTGCDHFGLLVGQRMNLRSLGLLGSLMTSMPDVEAALRALVSFFHIHTEGAMITLKVDDNLAILRYDITQPMGDATDQIGDGAVAMMLNVLRTLCGQDFQAAEASFARRTPADIKPFVEFFRIPLYFNAPHFALVFSRSWLDVRLPGANQERQRRQQQHIDAIKAKFSDQFPEQVRSVLRSALPTGRCSEHQIAALFGMTERTLIRRLESFGTGFQALVDECRFEMARQMLQNTSLNVGQIAESLGYSRATPFIRAFRRWSGTTPALWRAKRGEPSRR
jgi:AraC-like DNA-binding protein